MSNAAIYTISTPSVTIDGIIVPIIPNSLKYKPGAGEKMVRTQSSGGGQVDLVVAENAQDKFATVTLQIENTKINIDQIEQIAKGSDLHVISWFDSRTGYTRTVQNAVISADPEIGLGADTPLNVEFKGSAAI